MVMSVVQGASQLRKREAGSKGDGWLCWGEKQGDESRRKEEREQVLVIGWSHEQDGCRHVVKPRGEQNRRDCWNGGGEVWRKAEGGASVLHPAGVWSSQVPRGAVLPISIP